MNCIPFFRIKFNNFMISLKSCDFLSWVNVEHRPRIIKNLRAIKTILAWPFSLYTRVFPWFPDIRVRSTSTIKRHYKRKFGTLVSTAVVILWWQISHARTWTRLDQSFFKSHFVLEKNFLLLLLIVSVSPKLFFFLFQIFYLKTLRK